MNNGNKEKVAIVTGGGRGIGAAISRSLAQDGYSIAINYANDRESAEAVASDVCSHGRRAILIQADVSHEADVVRLFESTEVELGTPDVLVNNGGVTGGFSRVDSVPAAALESVFMVNVVGAFICCREAVRRMSSKHGGHGGVIINLSSRAAQLGGSGEWVHYAASKGALDTLTIGLAKEVALEGIRVNAIAAGLIETELHAAAGDPHRPARLAAGIPMGRPGSPEEIAQSVSWLVSGSASYVTGAILAVSGGR